MVTENGENRMSFGSYGHQLLRTDENYLSNSSGSMCRHSDNKPDNNDTFINPFMS